ncbi:MAG: AAA family ATPase [Candidatus Paceibacterota bacterium]
MKKVIGIVGGISSGKDTAAKYISEKLNIPAFEMSQPLKDIARERNIELTRENLVALGTPLAQEFGADYFAKILLGKIDSAGIFAGMRQIAQIEYLKNNSNFILISIEADPKIRFQRTLARAKLGEATNLEEFIRNEINENSGERIQRLFEIMKMADIHIENNGSLENFYNQIDNIILKLL